MSKKTKGKAANFIKPTISIPADLWPWAETRKNEPQHAGNLSSYVRELIIKDKTAAKERKEAA